VISVKLQGIPKCEVTYKVIADSYHLNLHIICEPVDDNDLM